MKKFIYSFFILYGVLSTPFLDAGSGRPYFSDDLVALPASQSQKDELFELYLAKFRFTYQTLADGIAREHIDYLSSQDALRIAIRDLSESVLYNVDLEDDLLASIQFVFSEAHEDCYIKIFGKEGILVYSYCQTYWALNFLSYIDGGHLSIHNQNHENLPISANQWGNNWRDLNGTYSTIDSAVLEVVGKIGLRKGHIWELCAGHGYLAKRIITEIPGIESYDFFELNGDALDRAQTNLAGACDRVHFHHENVVTTDYDGIAQPDLIIASGALTYSVLSHPSEAYIAFRKTYCALKEGGYFILTGLTRTLLDMDQITRTFPCEVMNKSLSVNGLDLDFYIIRKPYGFREKLRFMQKASELVDVSLAQNLGLSVEDMVADIATRDCPVTRLILDRAISVEALNLLVKGMPQLTSLGLVGIDDSRIDQLLWAIIGFGRSLSDISIEHSCLSAYTFDRLVREYRQVPIACVYARGIPLKNKLRYWLHKNFNGRVADLSFMRTYTSQAEWEQALQVVDKSLLPISHIRLPRQFYSKEHLSMLLKRLPIASISLPPNLVLNYSKRPGGGYLEAFAALTKDVASLDLNVTDELVDSFTYLIARMGKRRHHVESVMIDGNNLRNGVFNIKWLAKCSRLTSLVVKNIEASEGTMRLIGALSSLRNLDVELEPNTSIAQIEHVPQLKVRYRK